MCHFPVGSEPHKNFWTFSTTLRKRLLVAKVAGIWPGNLSTFSSRWKGNFLHLCWKNHWVLSLPLPLYPLLVILTLQLCVATFWEHGNHNVENENNDNILTIFFHLNHQLPLQDKISNFNHSDTAFKSSSPRKNNDVFLSFNYAKGYSKEATAGCFICLSLITCKSHYRIRDRCFCWETQTFPIKGGLLPSVSPPDSQVLRKLDSHWADISGYPKSCIDLQWNIRAFVAGGEVRWLSPGASSTRGYRPKVKLRCQEEKA